MEFTQLQQFAELIAGRTGLCVPERDWPRLGRMIGQRVVKTANGDADQYFQRLTEENDSASNLWRDLVRDLTVGESYFFRDPGQMALLRERLLPELIAQNVSRRCLRLWSAGCSTGEEPLTLAMLLDEILPQRASWNVMILGTDLNAAAIEKARCGTFGAWSFRGVSPEIRARYFRERGGEWIADPRLLSQVTWREGNLLAGTAPHHADGLHDFDLILCRNVFIYFNTVSTQKVLKKFSTTLREGGYLMTGHAETHGVQVEGLHRRHFPGSFVYQRAAKVAPEAPSAPMKSETPHPVVPPQPVARPSTPPRQPAAPAATVAPSANDLLRAAQTSANLGRYDEAAALCRRANEADPLLAPAHFLAAQLAEHRGEFDEAGAHLKRVIYLAPDFAPAYVELGSLYAARGDEERASRMRATAGELLEKLPPETVIEPFAPLTAGKLVQHLREMMGAMEAHR